jgi:hypothetical protein
MCLDDAGLLLDELNHQAHEILGIQRNPVSLLSSVLFFTDQQAAYSVHPVIRSNSIRTHENRK